MADPLNRWLPIEDNINRIGYELMRDDRLDEAIEFFALNIEHHPSSWNAYDSLGEAFESSGRTADAIASFRRSIELKSDSPTGLAALERLTSKSGL